MPSGAATCCWTPWQRRRQLSAEEVSATSGYAKTIQAYAFLVVLDTHTQDSIPIAVSTDVTAPPAPFVSRTAAFDRIVALLEEGNTELLAGGGAFPFTLPGGFTGFSDPASFATFNRALRARVAAYRQDWAGVLTALGTSFVDSTLDLQLGAYMSYGTGPATLPTRWRRTRRPAKTSRTRRCPAWRRPRPMG